MYTTTSQYVGLQVLPSKVQLLIDFDRWTLINQSKSERASMQIFGARVHACTKNIGRYVKQLLLLLVRYGTRPSYSTIILQLHAIDRIDQSIIVHVLASMPATCRSSSILLVSYYILCTCRSSISTAVALDLQLYYQYSVVHMYYYLYRSSWIQQDAITRDAMRECGLAREIVEAAFF